MAIPERDTVYTNDGTTTRSVYTREVELTGWFVGIIVALALLAIGYLVFSANSGPSTVVDTNTTTFEAPVTAPETTPAPMTEAPAVEVTPMTEAPAMETAPAVEAAPATETAPAAAPDSTAPLPEATPAPAAQ